MAAVTRRQHATGAHTPALSCIAITPQFAVDDLLTLQNVDSSLRTMTAHRSNPFGHSISSTDLNTSSELRTLHSVKYMLHLQDGVHTYVPEPLTVPQLVVPHSQRGSTLTHTMHHDGLPVPTSFGKSKPPTGKGGRSNRLTQTDNHMHHTSISIVILGKHIATMLRHNPYSLLRSTARTNLVERSYSQIFFFIIISLLYIISLLHYYYIVFLNFDFFGIFFFIFFFYLLYRLVSLSHVSLCVFPFLSLMLNPLNQSLNPGPEIEIDFRQ